MIVELLLDICKSGVLSENRGFKIITDIIFPVLDGQTAKCAEVESSRVRGYHTKSLGGGNMHLRANELYAVSGKVEQNIVHHFATTCGKLGCIVYEERAIRAELQGIGDQLFCGEPEVAIVIEQAQHVGTIGGTAAEAGTHWYGFVQVNIERGYFAGV